MEVLTLKEQSGELKISSRKTSQGCIKIYKSYGTCVGKS